MVRRRRKRRSLLLSALVVSALAAAILLALRPVTAAAQPLPRLPKMVSELYLPQEYLACGVMHGLYARLPEADRAKLHGGTKIPLDANTLTRDQARVVTAWFDSARWGCNPPSEQLDADGVRRSTLVFKCEDRVVEFCLRSPEQGIWKKLTIACAPERAEWVRDGLPLLPPRIAWPWEGGTLPPEPPPPWKASYWGYYALRDLYSAYANLPAGILRELHQSGDVSLPLAELPGPVRDGIAAGLDRAYAGDNQANGWPEETFRTPELRRRHFGIATVTFTYRRAHPNCGNGSPQGSQYLNSFPRPHRVVYLQPHFSPWAAAERVRVYSEVSERAVGYAKYTPAYLVAMPAEVQRHLCAFLKDLVEWEVKWNDERDGTLIPKLGAPPKPDPWP